jgi:4a-hydroxytetrahydrobiopterin dehydratase
LPSMAHRLTDAEVQKRLRSLRGWRRSGSFITKTYEFNGFMDGVKFIERVAEVAEKLEHHPDIKVRYTRVTLSIQTHDAGGLTAYDFQLAKAVDGLGEL